MSNVRAQVQQVRLPGAIEAFVREYVRQRRMVLFVRELMVLLVLLMGWMVGCCLVDRVWQLGTGTRGWLLGVTAAGFGAWGVMLLWRTFGVRISQEQAALELERMRPDLDERLATVCSRLRDGGESLASPEMLGRVAQEVEQYIAERGMPRLVSMRTVGQHGVCAAVMLLVVVGLSMLPLLGLPQLLQRLVMPWRAIRPVTTTRMEVMPAGYEIDAREGAAVGVNVVAVRPGPEGVILHYTTDGKTWDEKPLVMSGPWQYQAVMGPMVNDQWFYLSSGDLQTEVQMVRLMRKPAVTQFRIRYEYPAYMQREPLAVSNTDGLIEAPVGTMATVSIVASEKLASARMRGRELDLGLEATADPTVMQGSITIAKDQPYTLEMTSAKGLTGMGPAGAQIRAIADRPPYVRMVTPSEDLRLSPREITQLAYQVSDDYGVSDLGLRLQVNNAQAVDMPIKRYGDPRRSEGTEDLDLANLGLKVGDVVAMTFVAKDAAGQSGTSETRYVFISPHSVDSADYARMAELQKALDRTREMAKGIAAASKDIGRSDRGTPEKKAEVTADYQQHVAQMGENAEAAKEALTRAITHSTDTKLNDLLAAMADRAEVRMIEAHDMGDDLGKGDLREENARQRLERAGEQTKQMTKQLEMLVNAERAKAALSDRRNLQAAQQAQLTGRMTQRASEILDRMRQDVADQTRQLGLNPDDANVEKQLQRKAEQGKEVAKEASAVDFVGAAKAWAAQLTDEKNHPPMFDRRLAAGADVESVRPDGDLVWARDLNLSSRAALAVWLTSQDRNPVVRRQAEEARKQYAGAFEDLQRVHVAVAQPNPGQQQALQQAAEAARRRMAQWAGETDPLAGPVDTAADDERNRELAMEANAEMMQRRYDRSSELQQRMTMEQDQAEEATAAMQQAQAVDKLGQKQDDLRERVSAAGQNAGTLAQEQQDVARQIAAQMEDGATSSQLPRDGREKALTAIQAVQQKLAQMPQQLRDVSGAADVQFQSHELAERLTKAVDRAPEAKKETAQRTADRAAAAEQDARRETEKELAEVDPEVARVMGAALVDYLPETADASGALEKHLAPALERVKQGAMENKQQEFVRSVKLAREAIAEVQQELRKAQDALMDQDPLFAAKVYASAAADALSRIPPDVQAAMENQRRASESLGKQWQWSIHDAARARVAGTAQGMGGFAADAAGRNAAMSWDLAERQWGMLQDRDRNEASAPSRDDDPSGYRRMLQVYFRSLGKNQGSGQGGKK